MFYLYGLSSALDRKIRYVGVTTHPQRRLYVHRSTSRKGTSRVNVWIRSVHALEMTILHEAEDGREIYVLEGELVRTCKDLLNDVASKTAPCDITGEANRIEVRRAKQNAWRHARDKASGRP